MLRIVSFLACLTAVKAATPTATIDSGSIVGVETSLPDGLSPVNKFLGVPFARAERFAPPQNPEPWTELLSATEYQPSCMQLFSYPPAEAERLKLFLAGPYTGETEDCLTLNIFAPSSPAPPGGRAILYWVHGGAYRFGNAGQPRFDGSAFAAYEDVIVVTANYRNGVFGFPASPELPVAERNVAFLDQRSSLDWVQRNIHAFGGNPDKVTIFGARSVDGLVTTFTTETAPFRAAIISQGQVSYVSSPPVSPDTVRTAWDRLATELDCINATSVIECIRQVPATEVKAVVEEKLIQFPPVTDNVTQIARPAEARIAGNIAKVPLLIGTSGDEGRLFTVGANNITAFLQSTFPNNTQVQEEVASLYPIGEPGYTDYDIASLILHDFGYICASSRIASDSAASGIPTWRYFNNATYANLQFPGYDLRSYHTSDIPLIFSTYPSDGATAQQYAQSNFMRGAWARFAKNPTAGPGWNAVGTGDDYEGGAPDLDVGGLGINGQSGVTVFRQSEIESRCDVYDKIYDSINARS